MIEPEFWRLLATISATMIGLVFLGTMYYLESGWKEYEFYSREMEALTIRGAQIIIAYFSTVLVLSLLQEPFLPRIISTIAFSMLAVTVIIVTRSLNEALRAFENGPADRDSMTFKSSRVGNWIAFVIVFVGPPTVFRTTQLVDSAGSPLYVGELSLAWIAILALLFGYWNLIQFLLLPYEVRRWERDLE
ncbi:hypothetical protein OB919_11140 [Halobacteria archaeon AArc-curdl1]|uniref:Uncharacterized protein n=1 Tax=Natronosalvus hydrolyticus TaxID=2979988 RepID=A0AAP2Z897_9EURY|nr:hypothetical protein [Halobacteria archaeon AArc-curdl1]